MLFKIACAYLAFAVADSIFIDCLHPFYNGYPGRPAATMPQTH